MDSFLRFLLSYVSFLWHGKQADLHLLVKTVIINMVALIMRLYR